MFTIFVFDLGFHPFFSRFKNNSFFSFFIFLTIGIYFQFEYLQLYRKKFHLTPSYACCTILYFHNYEALFLQLLPYLLNYGVFPFFLLKWFRGIYSKLYQTCRSHSLKNHIENIFCVLSFEIFNIFFNFFNKILILQ